MHLNENMRVEKNLVRKYVLNVCFLFIFINLKIFLFKVTLSNKFCTKCYEKIDLFIEINKVIGRQKK